MFRNNSSSFHHHHSASDEKSMKNSKLQAVFSKLTGVIPRAQDLGQSNQKTMTSDIIESVLTDSPIPLQTNLINYEPTSQSLPTTTNNISSSDDDVHHINSLTTISTITNRLELELRTAKRTLLECGEVLLPCGLLTRISRDILSMAESEPSGIRGCLIYLNFEDMHELRKLTTIKCDPSTATTFELNLILQQNMNGWNQFIPQFIKRLTSKTAGGGGGGVAAGTIVVSPAYTLSKKKLYRSNFE